MTKLLKMPMKSLKKTSKIDLENEDLTIEDESRAQNTTNSTRCFCSPVTDGVKDKNILKKTGERFGVNAIGFQGVGTASAILFNDKNNANNFAIGLAKYQTVRITNPKAIELIEKAINNPNLDITNIKLELLYDALEEGEYEKLFDYESLIKECLANIEVKYVGEE